MAKARVVFDKLIQDSQDYGSTDEHMVSRVFFTLELEGKTHNDLYADIKQTVGSSFEIASLEVSPPRGYAGPFNHEAFRKAAEASIEASLVARVLASEFKVAEVPE